MDDERYKYITMLSICTAIYNLVNKTRVVYSEKFGSYFNVLLYETEFESILYLNNSAVAGVEIHPDISYISEVKYNYAPEVKLDPIPVESSDYDPYHAKDYLTTEKLKESLRKAVMGEEVTDDELKFIGHMTNFWGIAKNELDGNLRDVSVIMKTVDGKEVVVGDALDSFGKKVELGFDVSTVKTELVEEEVNDDGVLKTINVPRVVRGGEFGYTIHTAKNKSNEKIDLYPGYSKKIIQQKVYKKLNECYHLYFHGSYLLHYHILRQLQEYH